MFQKYIFVATDDNQNLCRERWNFAYAFDGFIFDNHWSKHLKKMHTNKSSLNIVKLSQIWIIDSVFLIHLTQDGILFCVKSIGKVKLYPKFGLIEQY